MTGGTGDFGRDACIAEALLREKIDEWGMTL